jgi:methionyl-tRNA synthetase
MSDPTDPAAVQPAVSAAKAAFEADKTAPVLDYETFQKVDLRVGYVLEAERVPKSDKLLKLQVNVGEPQRRQIVAGIGKSFTPEDMIGKQIVIVANLAPCKIMGVMSYGMVLAAGTPEDLAMLTPSCRREPGTKVK